MRRLLAVLSAALFTCLGGQDQPPDHVFRVSSTLIQVDAVVTDKQGKQIANLTPADFEIDLDGVAKPVTSLSYVALSGAMPTLSGHPPTAEPTSR